ncbi:hypothetical protein ABZ865_40620 [Streptomyces sp. NPDC047085]|jgi:hypothetical protein|uniref:hypothetical protein n=1 Tax=Streptomyces sp. NPDC047085 TaxID=3155140 RepID=UPI0033C02D48
MIVNQLVSAAIGMGFEHMVQARYGAVGVLSLLLLGAGIKAQNAACSTIGALLLVLLVIQA